MKKVFLAALASLLGFGVAVRGADPVDEVMKESATDLRAKMDRAAEQLNQTRARIAAEKAPLLAQLRAAEDRVLAADRARTRFDTNRDDAAEQRRKLLQELEALRKTTSFANGLAHDSLKSAIDGLAPGEDQVAGEPLGALLAKLDDPAAGPRGGAALDGAEFLATLVERELGGYRAEGRATLAGDNQVVSGTFVFTGPETFFLSPAGAAGVVRAREGAKYPVNHPLPRWASADATAFFAGQPAAVPADASGGRALRLEQTRGTVWQQVQKGGYVAYAILAVGLLSLLLIFQKIADLGHMAVESPEPVATFLSRLAQGGFAEAGTAVKGLRRCTAGLFQVGLTALDQPKVILEEKLQAVLLAQRLRYERRLPLLAVIATATPLMGLLGTVVGMVKTFALITVFGTGNAGKLAGGISEVLVATELGLVVAIPTLIVHGFLAHRIQKNLLQLERQALEFGTAAEMARSRAEAAPAGLS